MSSEIKQDLEVPYEIRLLEEIADELEIWARERKTDFRAKIDEALPEIQKYKTIDDFLSVLSTKPEIPEFYPLIRYFSIPDHYEELTTIKEWFQFNQRFHLSNMLMIQ